MLDILWQMKQYLGREHGAKDGSVEEVLVERAWGLGFDPQHPHRGWTQSSLSVTLAVRGQAQEANKPWRKWSPLSVVRDYRAKKKNNKKSKLKKKKKNSVKVIEEDTKTFGFVLHWQSHQHPHMHIHHIHTHKRPTFGMSLHGLLQPTAYDLGSSVNILGQHVESLFTKTCQ